MAGRRLLLAGLLLGAAACGKSKQAEAFDRLADECVALVGDQATLGDADLLFRGAYYRLLDCDPALLPLPSNDACAPAAGDARCQRLWYFYATDPALCGPNGCCLICEARALRSDLDKNGADAAVCGSRALREQPCISF